MRQFHYLLLAIFLGCALRGPMMPVLPVYAQAIPAQNSPTPEPLGAAPLTVSLESSTTSVAPGEEFRVDIAVSVNEASDNIQVRLALGAVLQPTFVSAANGTCQFGATVVCSVSASPDAPTVISLVLTVNPTAVQTEVLLQALAQDIFGNPAASDPLIITIAGPLSPTAPPPLPTTTPEPLATSLPTPVLPTTPPEPPVRPPAQGEDGGATAPTALPTSVPPTNTPTAAPTSVPTDVPTTAPTGAPTTAPTGAPTTAPTGAPTTAPTAIVGTGASGAGSAGTGTGGDAPGSGSDTLPETNAVVPLAALALLIGAVAMSLRTIRAMRRATLASAAPTVHLGELLPLARVARRRQQRHAEQLRQSLRQSERTRKMLD